MLELFVEVFFKSCKWLGYSQLTCFLCVYLFDGSLVLGGPPLLAVVQLLHVALQVNHLLLSEKEFKERQSSFKQLN